MGRFSRVVDGSGDLGGGDGLLFLVLGLPGPLCGDWTVFRWSTSVEVCLDVGRLMVVCVILLLGGLPLSVALAGGWRLSFWGVSCV